jgi:NADPH-dependent 2,4-dienoyl-CoA reductase/sulfur reductase-like enzyme
MLFFKTSHLITFLPLLTGVLLSPVAGHDPNCGCKTDPRSSFLRAILANSNYPNHPIIPTLPGIPLKVGIVGAGAAGLYSAVLLDSLGIDYDILEASDRVGGRIFTYRFNETAWDASTPDDPDYYDYYVGSPPFLGCF